MLPVPSPISRATSKTCLIVSHQPPFSTQESVQSTFDLPHWRRSASYRPLPLHKLIKSAFNTQEKHIWVRLHTVPGLDCKSR